MRNKVRWLVLLVLVCIPTMPAVGAIAFSNLGSNDTWDNAGTWMGNGPTEVLFSATSFVPTLSGQLTRLETAMSFLNAVPNQVTLYLQTSIGSVPPTASAFWSQTFTGKLASSFSGPLATFDIAQGPALQAGTKYWLYAEVPLSGVYDYDWWDGLSGTNDTAWYYPQSGTWQIFTNIDAGRSLRVSVNVPEPVGGALLIAAGATASLHRRRYRGRALPLA
jgi:hypothetical protein